VNPTVAETAIVVLGLGNLSWMVLLAAGKLKTAGPARKGANLAPAPTVKTSGQPRQANGRYASKTTLHEAGTEAA
jgi:hypothetical protein